MPDTAVVTGAARGIGRAIATRLAHEGWQVVVADLDAAELQAVADELGALAVPGDTSTDAGVQHLVDTAYGRLGHVDVFFANAGIGTLKGLDASDDEWTRTLETNVLAHVRAARHLVPRWLDAGGGRLVVTASAAGLLTMLGDAPYSVSKHGAVAFAEWLSATYRHRGIVVQAICPQGVQTRMLDGSGPLKDLLTLDATLTADEVADAAFRALAGDEFYVLPHPEVTRLLRAARRPPRRLARRHEPAPAEARPPDRRPAGERMTDQPNTSQRTAIVTGAARGIGAAVAKRLASDGYAVAVLDLDESACAAVVSEIESAGGKGLAVGVDVSDEAAVQAAVDRVASELGAPTVLVNNAGIIRDNMLFKMSADDWDAVMNVHLRGSFLMTRATQKHMIDAKFGRIVNLSSTSALGNRGQANYSAAKAGLQGFTKTLAIELGKFGVTANAIAPGFIATDMTRQTAERMGITFEQFLEGAAKEIPVARVGQPEDIAATTSFLVRDEAGFVSGQVIYVAGGPKD